MKLNRTFIVLVVALFLLMTAIEMTLPKPFKWEANFSHTDDQPLGFQLVDSLLAVSMPDGRYSVSDQTLSQLDRLERAMPQVTHQSYFIINDDSDILSEADQDALFDMARRGDKFLLILNNFYGLSEQFNIDNLGTNWITIQSLAFSVAEQRCDTLEWLPGAGGFPGRQWMVYDELTGERLAMNFYYEPTDEQLEYQAKTTALVTLNEFESRWNQSHGRDITEHYTDTIALAIPYGEGEIIFCGNPLMFTNYGVVKAGTSDLLMRLVTQVAQYPVVRVEPTAKFDKTRNSQSPLRFFLANKPLRTGLYLLLTVSLLAMIFTARRRQRVIPVITPPANRSLEMARHLGTLYFLRHDNADLLEKKYAYFTDEIRRKTMIDIDDNEHTDESIAALQDATGISRTELEERLGEIVGLLNSGRKITDKQLMSSIDYLNMILKKI